MKVLFVFGGLPHYYNNILNLINRDPNTEVFVITPVSGNKTIGEGVYQTKNDIQFTHIELIEYKTFYGKPFFRDIYKAIDNINPNILISGWPYYLGFMVNPFKVKRLKKSGVKFICKEIPFSIPSYHQSIQAFNDQASFYQRQERIYKSKIFFSFMKLLRKYLYSKVMDGAVVYTDTGIDILSSYGMVKEKIFVTHNSIETEKIFKILDDMEKISFKKFNLLHVGRLVKWKRVDLLIKAVGLLIKKYPEITLTIVGDGPEMKSLKEYANEEEITNSIVFKGAIYDNKILAESFLTAHIYILAGMGGLSINEAMCYGLPIVCSICDGTEKHLVYEDVNGKYFQSDNIESLVKTIDFFLSNHDLRDKFGRESLRIVRKEINEKTVVASYLKCFKGV